MKFYNLSKSTLLIFISVLLLTACVNTRKTTYFTDQVDGILSTNTPIPESVIQKNDLLSITVSSLNPLESERFNIPNNQMNFNNVSGINPTSGYLVDIDGNIQFPVLGNIKADGLTKEKLKDNIIKKITDGQLLKEPVLNVRILNFRVTVIGEVQRPSVVSIPNEKISLLEAIGLAGDLTIYGKRENVLVIREENGNKIIKRLDLNSSELLSSPYYYLKSNDIIYVEPNKTRIALANRTQQSAPLILSSLSLIAIMLSTFIK